MMLSTTRARLAALAAAGALSAGCAGVATAAPQQSGLVNVNISDVTAQVPVGVAANLCDVNAAVLAQELKNGGADCDATADSIATRGPGGGGNPPDQEGLVNVNISDVTVQVPVSVAANLCDINVAVLSRLVKNGGATCTATADTIANRGG
jgi:hypothetical protein